VCVCVWVSGCLLTSHLQNEAPFMPCLAASVDISSDVCMWVHCVHASQKVNSYQKIFGFLQHCCLGSKGTLTAVALSQR
jgi:hypothetical protein